MPQKAPFGRQTVARVAWIAEIVLENHGLSGIGRDPVDLIILAAVEAAESVGATPAGALDQAVCQRQQFLVGRGGELNHGPSPL